MPRSTRLLAAVATTFALAGCGLNPGSATVVGSERMSMDELDELAAAACTYLATAYAQQGAPAPGQGSVRSLVAAQDLQLSAARSLAEVDGVTVSPAEYEMTTEQVAQLDETFGDEAPEIQTVLERDFENVALRTALGAADLGVEPTEQNQDQLSAAGAELIAAELADADAAVDPRLGVTADGQMDGSTGSLSVPLEEVEQADSSTLPAAQQCTPVDPPA